MVRKLKCLDGDSALFLTDDTWTLALAPRHGDQSDFFETTPALLKDLLGRAEIEALLADEEARLTGSERSKLERALTVE